MMTAKTTIVILRTLVQAKIIFKALHSNGYYCDSTWIFLDSEHELVKVGIKVCKMKTL